MKASVGSNKRRRFLGPVWLTLLGITLAAPWLSRQLSAASWRQLEHITDQSAPDLQVLSVAAPVISGDWQSLVITGSVQVSIGNVSAAPVTQRFAVSVFEDANDNQRFDLGQDAMLAVAQVDPMAAWESRSLSIPLSGTSLFRDDFVHVLADSGEAIAEANEWNNRASSVAACGYDSRSMRWDQFEPEPEWAWTRGQQTSWSNRVQTTPIVFDLNRDGVPDVVFASHGSNEVLDPGKGLLRAIDGRTGKDLFVSTERVYAISSLAVADLHRDGEVEIVAMELPTTTGFRVLAFRSDGNLK